LVLGAMHLSWGVGFLTSPPHLMHDSRIDTSATEATR